MPNTAPVFSLGGGKIATSIGWDATARGVAIQPDGKIVVTGSASFTNHDFGLVVARYEADGTIDTTFGDDGVAFLLGGGFISGESGHDIALQPDGKIVVAGTTSNTNDAHVRVYRFNADGTVDGTFTPIFSNNTGERGKAVVFQPDGKIVVAGEDEFNKFLLARFNADGSLDSTFSGDGKATAPGPTTFEGLGAALQPDGKIVVASNAEVLRYEGDGDPDATFDGDGRVTLAGFTVDAVALQSDGKILLAGRTTTAIPDFAVMRLNDDGSVDMGFGVAGTAITNFAPFTDSPGATFSGEATGIVLQPNGQILVSGHVREESPGDGPALFALARYDADGTLDDAVTTDIRRGDDFAYDVALQADGRIVVVGESAPPRDSRFTVVRYLPDLSLDDSFVNDLNARPTYVEGAAPVVLDGDAQIYDADLDFDFGNYEGSRLTIERRGGANADDVFSATGLLSPLTEGEHIFYDRVHVGTVLANSGGTLTIEFRGTESKQFRVDATLQAIAYSNASNGPPANVILDYTFDDGSPGHGQGTGETAIATGSIVVDITKVANGVTRTGDDGTDTLTGTNDADTLTGLGGNDTLTALDGGDSISAGSGNDTVIAGGGNDVVSGGLGNDSIDGGDGYDVANYDGNIGAYGFVRDGATLHIFGNGESDVLTSVERVNFSDGVFDPLHNTRDFQGDGRDDILLRSSSGDLVLWSLDGSGILDREDVAHGLSGGWRLLPADPTGDGHADLFLYGNGALVLWRMRDGEVQSSASVREGMSPDWNLNAGDFTGDGQTDLLLNHANGAVVLWEMNGASVVNSFSVNEGVSPGWQISAADVNGDGESDILLRHANGALVEWEMHGGRITETRQIQDGISASWDVSFADVNGDRMADAVLHDDATGALVIWEMLDGRVVDSTSSQITAGSIIEVGHYTGDSGADILSRNPSGDVFVHELTGAQHLNDLLLAEDMSPAWTLL